MTIYSDRLGWLEQLIGNWSGEGHGIYPTIESFDYRETVTFADPMVKPFVAYLQRTSHAVDDRPLHTETGYLRWVEGAPEWVISSPTGVTEVHTGELTVFPDGVDLSFHTATVACTPSAKPVESVSRILRVRGDELEYELHMAAMGQPHQLHLRATLRRSP
jgi:hypothetical protein